MVIRLAQKNMLILLFSLKLEQVSCLFYFADRTLIGTFCLKKCVAAAGLLALGGSSHVGVGSALCPY